MSEPPVIVPPFTTAGKPVAEIHVRISYRIIQLFSEGLYASPTKAIEELVSKYFAATRNYADMPAGRAGSVEFEGEDVNLPLRELTAKQAEACLPQVLFGKRDGFKAIPLFGRGATRSWTIAIMSDLK